MEAAARAARGQALGRDPVEGYQDEDGPAAAPQAPQDARTGLAAEAGALSPLPSGSAFSRSEPIAEPAPGNSIDDARRIAGNGAGQPHAHPPAYRSNTSRGPARDKDTREQGEIYGALDLGTNNCRLLLARPSRRGFQVIDAFSRIIRLGEGVSQSGALSEAAMARTIEALKVCAGKIERHGVRRAMLVATEACRIAANGPAFLDRVYERTGLRIDILSREGEARLAVAGCSSLIDPDCEHVLVFDIGGGSSELAWLDLGQVPRGSRGGPLNRIAVQNALVAWTSLQVGVVTLAERFGGRHVTADVFEAMVADVMAMLEPFERAHDIRNRIGNSRRHLLGTSGTVTTVAGVHLGLPRYDRNRVDGCWLDAEAARAIVYDLLHRSYEERVAEPCIGHDRADLVLAGCAILEALMRMWPAPRLRVADRGLREGILMQLMTEDGAIRSGRRRRRRGGRRS